jgi:hypothetical protein
MVKVGALLLRNEWVSRLLASLSVCAAGVLGGCAAAPSRPSAEVGARPWVDRPMDFLLSETPVEVSKLWTQQVPGIMTDVSVARDGSAILIATVPNPEAGAGPRETGRALTRYDRDGKKVWRVELKGVVKSLALTDDAKLALVSTYDGELLALDAEGKTAWTAEGLCKPIPLGRRFLCYHDDDAEPEVAFDIYNAKGRKVLYYPIARDVLALKVSDDQRNVAIALDGGQVLLFDPEFRSLWQRQVVGEALDIAVSSGKSPRVAVIYNHRVAGTEASSSPPQALAVFDAEGRLSGDALLPVRASQVEAAPGGDGFAVYGNGKQGQSVAYYAVPDLAPPAQAPAAGSPQASPSAPPPALIERWRRGHPQPADYTSTMLATRDLVILGYERAAPGARHSHLVAFDSQGALKWNLPLVTQDGAYLYAHGFAPKPSLLAVGTDDGYLSAFRLREAAPALGKKTQAPGIASETQTETEASTVAAADAESPPPVAGEFEEIPVPSVQGNGEEEVDGVPLTVRIRPWISEGGGVGTSASERRAVNRFALGVDLDVGADLDWAFGALYEFFASSECVSEVGCVSRQSTQFSFGWFFVPHRAYVKLLGGAQTLAGTTPDAEGSSFTWTGGVAVGARLMVGSRFSLGIEGLFEASRAMATGSMLDAAAGSPRFPAQTLFAVGLVLGLDFGRLR